MTCLSPPGRTEITIPNNQKNKKKNKQKLPQNLGNGCSKGPCSCRLNIFKYRLLLLFVRSPLIKPEQRGLSYFTLALQGLFGFVLFWGIAEMQFLMQTLSLWGMQQAPQEREAFLQPDESADAVSLFWVLPFPTHRAPGERRTAERSPYWSRGCLGFTRGDLAWSFVTDGVDSLSTERGGKKRQFLTGCRRPVPLVVEGCVAPQLR